MNFIKLPEPKSKELYSFLHELKKDNWMVYDPGVLLKVYEWHVEITGFICAYEGYGEDAFCYMTRDLCLYFKKEIIPIKKKKCPKCRRLKSMDDFLGHKYCYHCRKKIPYEKVRK